MRKTLWNLVPKETPEEIRVEGVWVRCPFCHRRTQDRRKLVCPSCRTVFVKEDCVPDVKTKPSKDKRNRFGRNRSKPVKYDGIDKGAFPDSGKAIKGY